MLHPSQTHYPSGYGDESTRYPRSVDFGENNEGVPAFSINGSRYPPRLFGNGNDDDAPPSSYTHHGPHCANAGPASHEGEYAAQGNHYIDEDGLHGVNAGLASHEGDYAARLAARLAARNMVRSTMLMRFPHMRLPPRMCPCPHAEHHEHSNNYHGPHGANAGFASHYGDEAAPYTYPYNHCRRRNGSYVGHSPVPPQYPDNHN